MPLSIKNLFVIGMGLGFLTGCQLLTQPENRPGAVDMDPEAAEFLLKLSNVQPTESSCAAPPENLVGWWSGDSDANDYSGYNHHGLLHGRMITGTAYAGDGFLSESEASYMEVVTTPDLLPGNALTVEAWVYLDQYTYYPGVLSLGNVETFEESFSLFLSPWGNISMLVNGNATSGGRTMLVGPVLPPGQWFHVAGVYDGSQMQLYVNGKREVAKSHSGPLYPAPQNIVMGIMERTSDPLSQPAVQGALDEVSLYTRALSAAEIATLYDAGSLGKCRDDATLASLRAKIVIQDPEVLESMDQMHSLATTLEQWMAENKNSDPKEDEQMASIVEDLEKAESILAEIVELEEQLAGTDTTSTDWKTVQELEKRIAKLEQEFNKTVDQIQRDVNKLLKGNASGR